MEEKYHIKGIEKILEKVSKENLAKSYQASVDDDFEQILTEYFKDIGIPNNSEIAVYASLTADEFKERRGVNPQDIASEYYENDIRKRALYGISFPIASPEFDEHGELIGGNYGNILYFSVDEPIKESELRKIFPSPSYFVGGVNYRGLIMGKKYFEEHETELNNAVPNSKKREAVENYITDFVNEFHDVEFTGGYGPRGKYEETDEIRIEKQKNEQIILELTGKASIDEMSLKDFIKLRKKLEEEEKQLQKAFEDRFSKKTTEERS